MHPSHTSAVFSVLAIPKLLLVVPCALLLKSSKVVGIVVLSVLTARLTTVLIFFILI